MNIYTVFVTTLFITIFASSNLVAAADGGSDAKNLAKMDTRFSKLIVKPLVTECVNPQFKSMGDKRKLCENVKELKEQIELMSSPDEHIITDEARKGIYDKIHLIITEDASKLHTEYKSMLLKVQNKLANFFRKEKNKWAEQIERKVEEMKIRNDGKDLISAFKSIYLAFERELEGSCKVKKSRIECHKVVYELLCIGQQMLTVIDDDDWKHTLAYKPFAINLADHSLHIDPPKAGGHGGGIQENIQQIAKSWMQIDELHNLKDIEQQFYKSFVGQLMDYCDWHFGFEINTDKFGTEIALGQYEMKGDKHLCITMKGLMSLFTQLDQQNQLAKKDNTQESARKEIANILRQIHQLVMTEDLGHLTWECEATLTMVETEQIDEEIGKIGTTIKDLNTEFEKAFVQMHAQLKKVLQSRAEKSTIESRYVAYKLLRIGQKMEKLFKESDKENLKWAFQQFSANLAVYSLRLDHPKHNGEEGDIQKLASKWTIGMHDATATNDEPSQILNNE